MQHKATHNLLGKTVMVHRCLDSKPFQSNGGPILVRPDFDPNKLNERQAVGSVTQFTNLIDLGIVLVFIVFPSSAEFGPHNTELVWARIADLEEFSDRADPVLWTSKPHDQHPFIVGHGVYEYGGVNRRLSDYLD